MTDDFIGSLKADWDRQSAETKVVQLRRRRWIPHALLAGDILGFLALAGFGLTYAVLALRSRDALYALSAAAMLLVGLPLAFAALRARWRTLRWDDQTPEGVLTSSLRHIQATQQIMKLSRGGPYCLLGLALIVWAGVLAGLIRHPPVIIAIITFSWGLAAVAGLWWIRWRCGQLARERARCEHLLGQYEGL